MRNDVLIIVLATLTLSATASAECIYYEDYLHWEGEVELFDHSSWVEDFIIANGIAYVAVNVSGSSGEPVPYRLDAIDISEPATPVLLGSLNDIVLASLAEIRDLAFVDYRLYVTFNGGCWGDFEGGPYGPLGPCSGLLVFDASDPANMHVVEEMYLPSPEGIEESDGYVFIANGDEGLLIMDISEPGNFTITGNVDTPGYATGIELSAEIAYIADGEGGVQVVDVSDPFDPRIIGSAETTGSAIDLTVRGQYVYVTGSAGLHVIDIADPTNPWIEGSTELPADAEGICVSDNHAFIAAVWPLGVMAIEISEPENPQLVGTLALEWPYWGRDICVRGELVFVAGAEELLYLNSAASENPPILGSLNLSDEAVSVELADDWAYVAALAEGIQIIDLSVPENPMIIDEIVTLDDAYDISIQGDYACFVTDGDIVDHNFFVYDIASPGDFEYVGSLELTGNARNVTVSGSHAYLAAVDLMIVDIGDPAWPEQLATVDTPGDAFGVALSSGRAFVADGNAGLTVVDVSDPANAWIAGSLAIPGLAKDVAISGNLAYVTFGTGLMVIDVSNPESLQIVCQIDTFGSDMGPYHSEKIAISGNFVFIADEYHGMELIDVTDPFHPRTAGMAGVLGWSRALDTAASEDFLVLTDHNGLHVFPPQCDYTSVLDEAVESAELHLASFPNPFNPRTEIRFSLNAESRVSLSIFDACGRIVRQLLRETFVSAGDHSLAWDGRGEGGFPLPSGVYFSRLEAEDQVGTSKLTLLK